VTAGGISSGTELGFDLLRRAGCDEGFVSNVARPMRYEEAHGTSRDDVEGAGRGALAQT
jgi:hypothetical protein